MISLDFSTSLIHTLYLLTLHFCLYILFLQSVLEAGYEVLFTSLKVFISRFSTVSKQQQRKERTDKSCPKVATILLLTPMLTRSQLQRQYTNVVTSGTKKNDKKLFLMFHLSSILYFFKIRIIQICKALQFTSLKEDLQQDINVCFAFRNGP